MIVGDSFVWLHFPKCAGEATELCLQTLVPDAQFDTGAEKHDSIPERKVRDPSFEVGSREVICGFRRLPHWMLSRVHFGASLGWSVPPREMFVAGRFEMPDGTPRNADYNAIRYSAANVDHWVRTENIADDLARALKLPVDVVRTTMSKKNESPSYIRDLSFWFTKQDLVSLYRENPVWADLELKLYGSLLA